MLKWESQLKDLKKELLVKHCISLQNNYEGVIDENKTLKKIIEDLYIKFDAVEAEVASLKNSKSSNKNIELEKLIFEGTHIFRSLLKQS